MPRTSRLVPSAAEPRVADAAAFGAAIRAARTRQGLRIDDAAALCGVSVQLLHALETNQRSVGLAKALHVARQLGVTVLVVPTARAPEAVRAVEAALREPGEAS